MSYTTTLRIEITQDEITSLTEVIRLSLKLLSHEEKGKGEYVLLSKLKNCKDTIEISESEAKTIKAICEVELNKEVIDYNDPLLVLYNRLLVAFPKISHHDPDCETSNQPVEVTPEQVMLQRLRELVVTQFSQQTGKSKELGYWIFDGITKDIEQDWSEDQFFRWVRCGEAVYDFKIEHHELINDLTEEAARRLRQATARNEN